MRENILITGLPKSSKSTTVEKIVLPIKNRVGFFTREIRKQNERVGFEIINHRGETSLLASVDQPSSYKVSRYYVYPEKLETLLLTVQAFTADDFLYLDEIGQMQLVGDVNGEFKHLVQQYLDAPNLFLAVISQVYRDSFIEDILSRPDIILINLTPQNRMNQRQFLRELIKKIQKAKKYSLEPGRFKIENDHVIVNSDHGIRVLTQKQQRWECNCPFFIRHGICSHVLAFEDVIL